MLIHWSYILVAEQVGQRLPRAPSPLASNPLFHLFQLIIHAGHDLFYRFLLTRSLLLRKMYSRRRLKLRSRTGCSRCRTRHQKCDERRPSCGRCLDAGCLCVYSDKASGQTFNRHCSSTQTTSLINLPGTSSDVPAFVDSSHHKLLVYLIEEASSAISCHENIRYDTCRALLSVGSNYPCFLYSGLVFATLHKASFTHCPEAMKALTIQTLELRAKALSMLQSELQQDINTDLNVIIATALMLATCELRYSPRHSTWRNHFEVTRTLMEQKRLQSTTQMCDTTLSRFIDRRFNTIQFLVSLPTTWSPRPRPSLPTNHLGTLPTLETTGVIDGTMACCRELLEVFRWIGRIEDIKYWTKNAKHPTMSVPNSYCKGVARQLVSIVLEMKERDLARPPLLDSELGESPTRAATEEYRTLNTIAQHIALICLYRYNLGLADGHVDVVESVSSIIELSSALTKRVGLHPSICLTTALFTAGCVAGKEHQEQIVSLLEVQYEVTKSRNTKMGLMVLNKLWSLGSSVGSANAVSSKESGE